MARRLLVAAIVAIAILVLLPSALAKAAAAPKVVIIVGPVGTLTHEYKVAANEYAEQAASYGAHVVKLYTPCATWSRVKRYAQGANLLIYLGHGNGWPSPYSPYQTYTKDGFGLNPVCDGGNTKVKYWGDYYVRHYLKLAPGAIVFFNHLCYASGSSEPGHANPTLTTAEKRVDNYSYPFLKIGAKAVFATAWNDPKLIPQLFKTNRTMRSVFWNQSWASPESYSYHHHSWKLSWSKMKLDPYRPHVYYRSVAGNMDYTTTSWRASWGG